MNRFTAPQLLWTAEIPRSAFGNECVNGGNTDILICTTASGVSVGLLPSSGTEIWRHTPVTLTSSPLFSSTGIAFGSSATIGDYLLHAVSEGSETTDPSFWYVSIYNCSLLICCLGSAVPT